MLITRMIKLYGLATFMVVGVLILSASANSEPAKVEPQFKYLITGGPGAGQFLTGNPPHLVFTGKVKYYETPEDAFLEYPDFIERSILAGGEITFARVSNFRVSPKSGIVNGKYDSYCWDLYREIDGVSVEPLTCTGAVWMKPFVLPIIISNILIIVKAADLSTITTVLQVKNQSQYVPQKQKRKNLKKQNKVFLQLLFSILLSIRLNLLVFKLP